MSQEIKQVQRDMRTKKKQPETRIYNCSYCGYTSLRLFNVQRHEQRIHSKSKNPKLCCGQELLTKSQYYIHCEKHHPETRPNAITSREKYKISRYSVALNDNVKELEQMTLKRRFSARLLVKKEIRKTRSQASLSYKAMYSDMDRVSMEDIPLKYFITDHRLRCHMKRQSSLSKMNTTDENSEENNQEIASENGTQEHLDSFDLPAKNLINLPAKKLILHRFRKSTKRTFRIPLRDKNNNPDHSNMSQAMATATESVSLMQNYECRSKNSKWGANKENLPTFEFSFQQKIDIVLDSTITAPVVTQLQRDFLDSIDFDQYRIF